MNELQTDRHEVPDGGLVPERISQLPADFGWNRLIAVDTIILGEDALGHAEGAEHQVPDREGSGKVGVTTLVQRGVMPAMKDRRRDHVFQWPKGPVEICVDEGRVE